MNAKQRKQAEKIAAHAKALAEKHTANALKQIEKLSDLIIDQRRLKEELDIPALIAQQAEQNHLMEIQLESMSRCRTLVQMESEIAAARSALEVDLIDLDIRQETFRDEVRLKEGDLAYRKMKLDEANVPILEALQAVLIQLELEQDPQAIAEEIRKTYGIMEAKW